MQRHLDFHLAVGRVRRIAPHIQIHARCAADVTDATERLRVFRREHAGAAHPVRDRGQVVDDGHQPGYLLAQNAGFVAHRGDEALIQVRRHAAGDDAIHHEAVAEGLAREPLPRLAQPRELVETEGESDVVEHRADVADMVGDALALAHQGAQPNGARRHLQAGRLLHRHARGPGVRDGGVARDAPGQPREARGIAALGDFLDALVGVAEALFELEHGLAHRLKAKVPGFDNAGVHRPDRYFVDAAALGEQKAVLVVGRSLGLRPAGRGEFPAQRKLGILPRLMARPAACVRVVGEDYAQQVPHVALGTVGAGIGNGMRCQRRRGAGNRRARDQVGAGFLETGVDAYRLASRRAQFLAPARDPAASPGLRLGAEPAPVLGPNQDELRRREPRRGLRLDLQAGVREADQERGEPVPRRHSGEAPAMSIVACSNQRDRKPGIASPSQSTRTRCTTTGSIFASTGFCPGGGSPNTILCM